jgi:hypothetical protein
MIGRNRDVRGAAFDHAQHRGEDASDCRDLHAVLIPRRGQRVVVPEQLVSSVNQIDFHSGLLTTLQGWCR